MVAHGVFFAEQLLLKLEPVVDTHQLLPELGVAAEAVNAAAPKRPAVIAATTSPRPEARRRNLRFISAPN